MVCLAWRDGIDMSARAAWIVGLLAGVWGERTLEIMEVLGMMMASSDDHRRGMRGESPYPSWIIVIPQFCLSGVCGKWMLLKTGTLGIDVTYSAPLRR